MNFDEWRNRPIHKGQFFIEDGIIDEELWHKSGVKILFLLKEAYDSDPNVTKEWNLSDVIREEWKGPKFKIWWTAALWAYGLKNINEDNFRGFPEGYKANPKVKDAFLSSAIVNLKKSKGVSSSSDENLKEYMESDYDLILRQIAEIKPLVVVCCSTWHLIEPYLDDIKKICDLVYKSNGTSYVDFWHPSNHYPNKLNYYALCSVVSISRQSLTR